MRKNYQNEEIDTSQPAVPDMVSVALAELAGEMREGLLALAVGTGLQAMAAIMEADVTAVCGPKGRHDPERTAVRHGHGAGSVSLGGRRVSVERPRMRAVDGSGKLPVASYELFSDTEILGRMALDRMLAGLSTRRYPVALEPVGAHTEKAATATSRSAVSRRFVAQTETALAQLLGTDLSQLDLVAFMVDGVHFGEHTCIVALGIDIDGVKHPLSLVEGASRSRERHPGPPAGRRTCAARVRRARPHRPLRPARWEAQRRLPQAGEGLMSDSTAVLRARIDLPTTTGSVPIARHLVTQLLAAWSAKARTRSRCCCSASSSRTSSATSVRPRPSPSSSSCPSSNCA